VKTVNSLKVAIVCDWLTGIGGAEQVVLELHKMFPKAPIYTSAYDPKKIDWFKNANVQTTWVNKFPNKFKKFLPVLRAISFSSLNLNDYDLVISSSGAEAKAIKTKDSTIHINYCHSPTHYYWQRYNSYLENPGFGKLDWLARLGLKILVGPMRRWDLKAAQRPDYIITNSNFTKSEILKYYKRESTVIHPPVNTEYYSKFKSKSRSGYVIAGRQTPYKRFDLAVAACTKLNLNLNVIGNGPDNKKLKSIAGPTINFLGQVSDEIKADNLAKAEAFIFPGIDDFGIAAVESLATGTPLIAYKAGGALDYVNTKTGNFFENQTVNDVCSVLNDFKKDSFDHKYIIEYSKQYSIDSFKVNISKFIAAL